jgi:hypothetical protein
MNIDPELFQVIEAPKRKVDPRIQCLHDLQIDTNHPLYIEQKDNFEMFPPEIQCIFYEQLKKDIDNYNECMRMADREKKLKIKMDELSKKRRKKNFNTLYKTLYNEN